MGGVTSTFDKMPSCYGGGHTLPGDQSVGRRTEATPPVSHLMNHPLRRSRLSEENSNQPTSADFNEPTNKLSLTSCAGVTMPSALQHLHGRSYSKLQTLRKKMSKLRRRGNNQDYRKQFRELVSGWNYRQLHSLRQEYEALSVLKELTMQAMSARPVPPTLKNDLSYLFDSGWCSDFQLIYRGTIFNVHQAILSARCPFFKMRIHNWLAKPDVTYSSGSLSRGTAATYAAASHRISFTENGSQAYHFSLPRNSMPPEFSNPPMPIEIDGAAADIDTHVFQCLLKYLYSGYLCMEEAHIENWDTLNLLSQKFGIPNTLEDDMEKVLANGNDTDCVLVFTCTSQNPSLDNSSTDCGCTLCATFNQHFSMQSQQSHHIASSTVYNISGSVTAKHRANHFGHCSSQQDCRYIYNCDNPSHSNCGSSNRSSIQQPPYELHCHKSILAARSRFFRNIILRRMQESTYSLSCPSGDPLGVSNGHVIVPAYSNTLRIVLDESIVPRRLATVILHCLYSDQLDINLVGKIVPSSMGNVHRQSSHYYSTNDPIHSSFIDHRHLHPGETNPASLDSCRRCLDDVIQLYEIGQFIEFSILCKNCEDLLVKHLCLSNFLHILRWSGEPNGSAYVHRHVTHFIQENFLHICYSTTLFELTQEELATVISSHFLQARESDVLSAVIRWGEYKLRKIIEEKDPNCSTSMHPHSKKSIKKKDLNDNELADLISELLPLVRLEQVLPSSVDQVQSAIRRGLISHPPPLYMMQTNLAQNEDRVNYWCRFNSSRLRLIGGIAVNSRSSNGSPIIGESSVNKAPLYQEQISDSAITGSGIGLNGTETPRSSPPPRKMNQLLESAHKASKVVFKPPRLFTPFYEEIKSLLMEQYKACKSWLDPPGLFNRGSYKHSCDDNQQPCTLTRTNLFDHRVLKTVRKRAKDLEQQLLVQRALLMSCIDRPALYQQLHLRALRECGMPDEVLFNKLYQLTPPSQTAAWVSPDHPCVNNHSSPSKPLTHDCTSCGNSPRKYVVNYRKKNKHKTTCRLHNSTPSTAPFTCQDASCPSWLPFSSVPCPHNPISNDLNERHSSSTADNPFRRPSEIKLRRSKQMAASTEEVLEVSNQSSSQFRAESIAVCSRDEFPVPANNNGLVTPFLVRDSLVPGVGAARRSLSQSTSSLSSINQSLDDLRLCSEYGGLSTAPPDVTAGISSASCIPPADSLYGASAYPFHMPSVSVPNQNQHTARDSYYHIRSISEPFGEEDDLQASWMPDDSYFYEARQVALVRRASPEPEEDDEFEDNDGEYEENSLFV